ncbi:cyclin-like protein [Terfezia boudieri ATCC MYA-4762]|uniref:B-related factor 1 n=1 Tax=Terfezia boudieri ATCC MYA-4762 TaxID=1051890 RepID=A0A3N4LP29_9PEZI|nr:cyclin-like protein [Terfezia boudieri ATCC MYA-4762]
MARNRQTACCSNPALDDSDGQTVCTNCGSVINDSQIVSEISFGETSSGAAVVNGAFVGAGETHTRNTGPFRKGGGLESREQTLANARRKILQLAAALSVPDSYTDAASRWFTLALTNGFTHGRRTQYVVACCLYAVCRQEKSSHMLIDFSDILHINVFHLGQTYLKLVRLLHIPTPTIDPSVYIHRFAKHLEFGKDTMKVASDAIRLVSRMNRDWITQGRRPSGICGACLVLAARMNNYRRSVREVVYVVKVADLTIQKRLEEFKLTDSSSLTVDEFRTLWLEQSNDPPSFGPKKTKKRKRVRNVNDDGEVIEGTQNRARTTEPALTQPRRDADGFAIPELPIDPTFMIDPALLGDASLTPVLLTPPTTQQPAAAAEEDPKSARIESIADAAIESEINNIMSSTDSLDAATSLEKDIEAAKKAEKEEVDATKRRNSRSNGDTVTRDSDADGNDDDDDDDDDLSTYDDWETTSAILTPSEALIKERIWTEMNKEYIKEQEAKKLKAERDARNGVGKGTRKRRGVGRGGRGGRGGSGGGAGGGRVATSPAESAKEMLAKRTYSKKINYAALDHLFQGD